MVGSADGVVHVVERVVDILAMAAAVVVEGKAAAVMAAVVMAQGSRVKVVEAARETAAAEVMVLARWPSGACAR